MEQSTLKVILFLIVHLPAAKNKEHLIAVFKH